MITAEKRYEALKRKRAPYLRRAQACSELSIPSLIPPNEDINDGDFQTPYQSIAARGVNNLASKLMLALLPTNAPFFKLTVDTSEMSEEELRGEMKAEVDRGLAKIERAVIEEIAGTSDRVTLFEALKHLIVGGNALLYVDPEGGMKCYHLNSYVVSRDGRGVPQEIILKETVGEHDIPEETLQELRRKGQDTDNVATSGGYAEARKEEPPEYVMYTQLLKESSRWVIRQEVRGVTVHGSEGTYPIDAMPWIPMRLLTVSGSDYGRSYIEEYYGDIASLEGLSQAILEGAAAAAKVVFMIAPNSTTRETDLAEAPNLSFVSGNRADVEALQLDKQHDFRVARESMVSIEQRLEHAFILNSAIQRNAERVTAEEIRKMIEDLETALGGVYSLLAVEFQLPYVTCRIKQLSKSGRIPPLPKDLVKPIIITGVEALGRGNDLDKLNTLITMVSKTLGPEAMQYFNKSALLTRLCTSLGIDTEGLVISEEEITSRQQEEQTQQMAGGIAPDMMKLAGQYMKQNPEVVNNMLGVNAQTQQQQQ